MIFSVIAWFGALTTAASRPTIWRIVISEVLSVGRIQPKNAVCECASCGENPKEGRVSKQWTERWAEIESLPFSFVRGANRTGHRVLEYSKSRKETTPIVSDRVS